MGSGKEAHMSEAALLNLVMQLAIGFVASLAASVFHECLRALSLFRRH